MAAKRDRPAAPEAAPPTPTAPVERFGPLLVERLGKGDGRALILYAAAPERG